MEQFVVFITHHWILSTLWGICLAGFFINEYLQRRFNAKSVTPEQAVLWINHQGALVIDIRGDSAFAEGHILDSEHFPKHQWEKKIKNLHKQKEKPIILVCNAGHDSLKLANELQQKGFVRAVTLGGGIQAWKMAGLPLVKS